jgi:hypothetical protein
MFFEVPSLTYHSPITIESLTYGVSLSTGFSDRSVRARDLLCRHGILIRFCPVDRQRDERGLLMEMWTRRSICFG